MHKLLQRAQKDGQIGLPGPVADARLGALRTVLAVAALLISLLDPPAPGHTLPLIPMLLAGYIAVSVGVYFHARRQGNLQRRALHFLTWLDLAFYTVLIFLSGGSKSVFFVFYFFPIIAASTRDGVPLGLKVTCAAALLSVAAGFVTPSDELELNRFLMRPFSVVALGYILSYWGGAEKELRQRLGLLKELSLLANPRFGADWTIDVMLRKVMAFWDAEYCLMLLSNDTGLRLYLVSRADPSRCKNVDVRGESEIPFIDISDSAAVVYSDRRFSWQRPTHRSYDPKHHKVAARPLPPGEAIAEFLNASSYVGAPLQYRERLRGRLLVSSSKTKAYSIEDAVFLQQVASQILPIVENIRLVDRLAADASEEERNRIARSVHDRVIQPYYGLQIGLKALHTLLQPKPNGNGHASERAKEPVALLAELMDMTSDGINELRAYVSGLKESKGNATHLTDSINRFASKFESATGIHVKVVDATNGFVGNGRLTAELFQMATEALSNVHRHTQARSARVSLKLNGNMLQLQVENDLGMNAEPVPFRPASISDRAEGLGGRTEVSWADGRTILKVEIPL